MDKNQKIKCDVNTCEYNQEDCMCGLHEIKVGCQCGCNPTSCKETVCDSYKFCDGKK